MAKDDKVIITCAVTGAIHTPSMSDHLPLTPDQVAEQAIGAAEAGASILHLHARDPKDGRPTPDPAVFMEFLPRIKQNSDAVINITTGGGLGMTVEERMAAALVARPEVASLNMGSINFGIFQAADRIETWKYDWEEPYLRGTDDFIFRNTFKDIERILRDLGEAHGTRFEFECYDVGHLYNLAYFLDRGLVRPPLFVQTIFGAGRHQMSLCTMGAMMGGNVRVGLEDSLYLARGQLAESNAQQVAKIRRIVEELSLEVATPEEARARLDLKGGDAVGF
ncbi:MAG: 3-keto-5-aminohexanoate cleavage protein [Defluviicoccus sp.]|nr:3-keto-5-aminohexanoate cleavage protein [Defluviicoccus sp.]